MVLRIDDSTEVVLWFQAAYHEIAEMDAKHHWSDLSSLSTRTVHTTDNRKPYTLQVSRGCPANIRSMVDCLRHESARAGSPSHCV